MRESVSFKKNEEHIRHTRDTLCKHYKLNKSDLYKYLIRKDSYNLESRNKVFLWHLKDSSDGNHLCCWIPWKRCSLCIFIVLWLNYFNKGLTSNPECNFNFHRMTVWWYLWIHILQIRDYLRVIPASKNDGTIESNPSVDGTPNEFNL